MVEVYHELEGFKAKRQHLSLVAPHFPYEAVMATFRVSRHLVWRARMHASEHGAARCAPAP